MNGTCHQLYPWFHTPLLALKTSRVWNDRSSSLYVSHTFVGSSSLTFKTPQWKHRPKNALNSSFLRAIPMSTSVSDRQFQNMVIVVQEWVVLYSALYWLYFYYLHVLFVDKNNVTKWHHRYWLGDLWLPKYVSSQISEIFLHSILISIKLFINLTHSWLELIKFILIGVFVNLKSCEHFFCIEPFILTSLVLRSEKPERHVRKASHFASKQQ